MIEGISIQSSAVYDDIALQVSIGLSQAVLTRARRERRLRFSRQGRRIVYLGEWILDWLERDSSAPSDALSKVGVRAGARSAAAHAVAVSAH
jgi:hypothetical protein